MADRKAASVLPDPVGAMTSAFSPRRIAAQARSWTDVGPSGKAETNQARVAGAKPFSADPGGPVGSTGPGSPAGPAGPGDSAGLAGPDAPDDPACPVDPSSPVGPSDSAAPDDPACSASPGDPAGPDDSGGSPGSVLAGSAGSSPPAVRMLTSSPVFPIFSSRRPVPGSHPASALPPSSASHSRHSRPPLEGGVGTASGKQNPGNRTPAPPWGPELMNPIVDSDTGPAPSSGGAHSCSAGGVPHDASGSLLRGARPHESTPDGLSRAQRPTVRLLLQGDPNSPHRGITYR